MTAGGWIAMVLSVSGVLLLNAWCLWRLMRTTFRAGAAVDGVHPADEL